MWLEFHPQRRFDRAFALRLSGSVFLTLLEPGNEDRSEAAQECAEEHEPENARPAARWSVIDARTWTNALLRRLIVAVVGVVGYVESLAHHSSLRGRSFWQIYVNGAPLASPSAPQAYSRLKCAQPSGTEMWLFADFGGSPTRRRREWLLNYRIRGRSRH
jgi:hypothetical protein